MALTPQQMQAADNILGSTTPPAGVNFKPTGWYSQAKSYKNPVAPQPTQTPAPEENPLQKFGEDTNANAAHIVDNLSQKPSFAGAVDTIGTVGKEVGDIASPIIKGVNDIVTPAPIREAASKVGGAIADAVSPATKMFQDFWGKFSVQHPDTAKVLAAVPNIAAMIGGNEVSPTAEEAVQGAKTGASTAAEMAAGIPKGIKNAVSPGVDSATTEAVGNIAKQEGGIVAPAKTASQLANESNQKTWDVIKPSIKPSNMTDAAASGRVVRQGETGVITQVPTQSDAKDILLAKPYVTAANGDPLQTAVNMKNGIATEAKQLRAAVGEQGGTFTKSQVKGVLNKVNVPLAIKNGPEMAAVKNINEYVAGLSDKVAKNAGGALDLSQKFRSGINSEFGEAIWGKNTPIGNYIKNVNQSLNEFISTRLPEGKLPDGTLIKDSFKKQSDLYRILGNIKVPKVGDALINPTEEAPLKVPGSPLSEKVKEFGKNNPITHGVAKTAIKAAGMGAGLHLIP